MSNFTDFFPAAGGGGGGIPKYEEFTASGTFTPSQDLIDAGGRIAYIIVGGGEKGAAGGYGGAGGMVVHGYATLTSTTGCAVTIGAGGTCTNCDGGDTTVAFASAGGTSITAKGGGGLFYGTEGQWAAGYSGFNVSAHPGVFGYGRGGGNFSGNHDNDNPIGKYGSGTNESYNGIDGFVRITWFE